MPKFPQHSQKSKKMLIFDEFGSANHCGEKFMQVNSMNCIPFLKSSRIRTSTLFSKARPTSAESFNMVFHNASRSMRYPAECN